MRALWCGGSPLPTRFPGCSHQVAVEEPGDELEEMGLGARALADAMGAVGIFHHLQQEAKDLRSVLGTSSSRLYFFGTGIRQCEVAVAGRA